MGDCDVDTIVLIVLCIYAPPCGIYWKYKECDCWCWMACLGTCLGFFVGEIIALYRCFCCD